MSERLHLVPPDAPCAWCRRTPASGAWNEPCPVSPRGVHDTVEQLHAAQAEVIEVLAVRLDRNLALAIRTADTIRQLPRRHRRRFDTLTRAVEDEAGRTADMLALYCGRRNLPINPISAHDRSAGA